MGEGRSLVRNYLDAADTRATLAAVEALGGRVALRGDGPGLEATIHGLGLQGPSQSQIDVGNAGR